MGARSILLEGVEGEYVRDSLYTAMLGCSCWHGAPEHCDLPIASMTY